MLALFSIALDCQGSAESLFQDGLEAYQTGEFAIIHRNRRREEAELLTLPGAASSRRRLPCFLFLGGLIAALFGISQNCQGSAESLFQDGLEAYQTGQFASAAKEFRESTMAQPAAGTLVNLGVVEWRRGRTGPAILAWEQALWVDAFDQRARDNLRFGRTVAGVDEPRLRWYEVASTWLPTNSWGWITAGGLWLALGMFLLPGILRWRRAGWQQVLAALGLCIFLLSLPAQLGVLTRARVGFVLGKKTPLRLSPTVESETITVLGAGEPVRQLRRRGGYVFVQTENSTGWVEREDIGLICPQ